MQVASCLCPDNVTYVCWANLTASLFWKSIKLSDVEYTYRDNAGKVRMLGNVTANLTNKVLRPTISQPNFNLGSSAHATLN